LQQQQQQQQQQQPQQQLSSAGIVVGDEYYAAKEQLFMAEQAVLRLMRFEFGVDQPHKYLLNFCRLLEIQQQLAAAAVCVLNDCVVYTDLVCIQQAAVVAAAALQHVLERPEGLHSRLTQHPGVADARRQSVERGLVERDRMDMGHGHHRSNRSYHAQGERDSRTGSHRSEYREAPGVSRDPGVSRTVQQAVVMSGEWTSLVGLVSSDVITAKQEIQAFYQRCNTT
jgi:hypothetical protein